MVHRASPEVKVAAAFVFVAAVALTPRTAVWAFAGDAVVLATVVVVAGLPWRFVLARLAVVLPFVAFALLIPFVAGGERTDVFGVGLSVEGLWATWNVLAKATLGAGTSIVLAGTTEPARLLRGLERLRVPTVLTTIASFMLRYLEVIAGEVSRMRTAMTARAHDPRWLWQLRPIASAAGALFVRSYERGERVHAAMLARGFSGAMPDLDPARATSREWMRAAAVPLVPVVLAIAAAVVA